MPPPAAAWPRTAASGCWSDTSGMRCSGSASGTCWPSSAAPGRLEGGEEVPPRLPGFLLLEVAVGEVPIVGLRRGARDPPNRSPEPAVIDVRRREPDVELLVSPVRQHELDHLVNGRHRAVV